MTCFKAYDIRGRVPDELNEDVAVPHRARLCADWLKRPGTVVVGHDMRLSETRIVPTR